MSSISPLFPILPVALVLTLVPLPPVEASSRELGMRIDRYVENGGVVVVHEGDILHGQRARESFIPASTLKIATALAALGVLGSDYRFKTELYVSPSADLTIRGYGDPFLVSEELEALIDELSSSGKLPKTIRNVYLDSTAFADVTIPGIAASLNPYDASNAALAVNFNTIYVEVERSGRIRSAESQTPLTPLGRRLAAKLSAGKHRINISRDSGVPVRYVGELVRAFLERKGHVVSGEVSVRPLADPVVEPVLVYRNSRTLEEVVSSMMLYSNNFIANQVLMVLGLEKEGEPATLEKGVRRLEAFLTDEVGLDAAEFQVVEGSGISRQNRFTPLALAEVVRAFRPYRHLLARQGDVPLKTGTLSGVYALAGYLPSERPLCFVILLNQHKNHRDQVLSVLTLAVAEGAL